MPRRRVEVSSPTLTAPQWQVNSPETLREGFAVADDVGAVVAAVQVSKRQNPPSSAVPRAHPAVGGNEIEVLQEEEREKYWLEDVVSIECQT